MFTFSELNLYLVKLFNDKSSGKNQENMEPLCIDNIASDYKLVGEQLNIISSLSREQ